MLDLVYHAAHGGRVLKRALAVQLVEAEPDQRMPLGCRAPVGARNLLDRDGLAGFSRGRLSTRLLLALVCHGAHTHAVSAAASGSAAAPSRRLATISLTFLPRRAATARGFSWAFKASNVARTML